MPNLHLVTGYAGTEHVTAEDQGAFHALTMGAGQYVINKGELFAASIVTNNQIKVMDGEIYMHGRYIRMEPGSYTELAIESGEQGKKRYDLVVARYTKGLATGIEEANLVVIKGTASETSPTDPEYISGDILSGATENDLPLHRVIIDGLTITGIETVFDTPKDFGLELKQDVTNLLTAENALSDEDYIPFFDASADAQRKVLWSIIKAAFASTDHLSQGILPPERGGTGFNNLTELSAALSAVKIAVGSYTGNGHYTSGTLQDAVPKSLTFDFVPKFVFITADWNAKTGYYGTAILTPDYGHSVYEVSGATRVHEIEVSVAGKTITFSPTGNYSGGGSSSAVERNEQYAMNAAGVLYHYFAAGI